MALKTFTTADGSANQALVTNGSGVLSFAAVGASAGQVIQVLGATDTTERNTSSTSYTTASNTLSVTITPSSASNKIFIIASSRIYTEGNTANYTLFKDSTNLANAVGMNQVDNGLSSTMCLSFLDSPATTSAITYQVYFKVGGGGTAYLNPSAVRASITCFEIKG